jgi:phosphohistidine swiveling domain-containing protein
MKVPSAKEYDLTFESPGLMPLFQEIVCVSYMPTESILLFKDHLQKSFTSKRSLRDMEKFGEQFYSTVDPIQETTERLRGTFSELEGAFEACDQLTMSKGQFKHVYSLLQRVHEDYRYLGHGFTDTVYVQALEDIRKKEALTYLEVHKNLIREMYTALLFTPGAGLSKFAASLASQFALSPKDVECYLHAEVLALFEGIRVEKDRIAAREMAYVFWKPDESHEFLEGDQALAFIERFGDVVPRSPVSEFKGIVANRGQGKVAGRVRIIESDYMDPQSVTGKMDLMQSGDILVASTTAPDLLPACMKAAAIVTDVGGVLSHGAIISRELGIIGIVNTQYASKVLKDDDMVEVDAERGVVRKI